MAPWHYKGLRVRKMIRSCRMVEPPKRDDDSATDPEMPELIPVTPYWLDTPRAPKLSFALSLPVLRNCAPRSPEEFVQVQGIDF